ncbi:MAG: cysteine desulfurase family protein [Cellulosilyticaceae bacterium]
MGEIYLDNAATTRPLDEVIDAMCSVMKEQYGNPSSLHKKGMEAETKIKQATQYFEKVLGAAAEEIIYTSGGTESNNLAIIGTAMAHKRTGKRIITSAIEHASVKEVFDYLAGEGFEVIELPVDTEGKIDLMYLEESINHETILVSIMHVNNEVGVVQDIEKIGKLIKKQNSKTLFHVDAIQSFTKVALPIRSGQIDLVSISGHKFYGPKGIGLLYKNKRARILNLVHGGGQQKNMRSGTENVPGIVGMHVAAEQIQKQGESYREHLRACKVYLGSQILEMIPDTHVNGPALEDGAPHILNIGFKDVRAEVLLHALEQEAIFVSSGSACSSNKVAKAGTLVALGLPKEHLDNAIRFSFGIETTMANLDQTLQVLKDKIAMLRKYTLRR